MTVVLDELHAGHAVLMVRTDRGDFILDNKTNAVLPWSDTPYGYHKREGLLTSSLECLVSTDEEGWRHLKAQIGGRLKVDD